MNFPTSAAKQGAPALNDCEGKGKNQLATVLELEAQQAQMLMSQPCPVELRSFGAMPASYA